MSLRTIPNLLAYYWFLRRRRKSRRFYKKVAIFKPDGLGDLVLALSAIRLLLRHFGDNNCVLIVCPLNAELARREFPTVEQVVLPGFDARMWRNWPMLRKLPVFEHGVEQFISLRHHRPFHQDVVVAAIPHKDSIGIPSVPALRAPTDRAPCRFQ